MLFKRKWGFYFLTVALCLSLMSSVNAFHDDNDHTTSNYFKKGYVGETFFITLWLEDDAFMELYDSIEMDSWDPNIVQLDHIVYSPWYDFTNNPEFAYFKIVGNGTTTITVHRPPRNTGETYECEVVGRNPGEAL